MIGYSMDVISDRLNLIVAQHSCSVYPEIYLSNQKHLIERNNSLAISICYFMLFLSISSGSKRFNAIGETSTLGGLRDWPWTWPLVGFISPPRSKGEQQDAGPGTTCTQISRRHVASGFGVLGKPFFLLIAFSKFLSRSQVVWVVRLTLSESWHLHQALSVKQTLQMVGRSTLRAMTESMSRFFKPGDHQCISEFGDDLRDIFS